MCVHVDVAVGSFVDDCGFVSECAHGVFLVAVLDDDAVS